MEFYYYVSPQKACWSPNHKVFEAVIQLRRGHEGDSQSNMTGVLTGRGGKTQTHRELRIDDRGGAQNDAAESRSVLRAAGHHQKPGRGQEGSGQSRSGSRALLIL